MSKRLASLRDVEFSLDRLATVRVAGLDLSRLRSFDDLTDAQRSVIALAAAAGDVPLDLELIVRVRNPALNSSTAELFSVDWVLLLDERETVSGRSARRLAIRPGQVIELPVPIRLNLAQYFGRDAAQLLSVLRSTIGERGMPLNMALRAKPSVGTAYGPMRYPASVMITRRVGVSEY